MGNIWPLIKFKKSKKSCIIKCRKIIHLYLRQLKKYLHKEQNKQSISIKHLINENNLNNVNNKNKDYIIEKKNNENNIFITMAEVDDDDEVNYITNNIYKNDHNNDIDEDNIKALSIGTTP